MAPQYVVGVDGGTEGIRASVFDTEGNALAFASCPYGTIFPRPGWAEQVRHETAPLLTPPTSCIILTFWVKKKILLYVPLVWSNLAACVRARLCVNGSCHGG